MIDLDDIDTDEDGALTATVELPGGRRVTVEYEFDEEFDYDDEDEDDEEDEEPVEREDLPDLETMQETVKHALARLTEEILEARESEVVEELTEAAYEDDDEADLVEALQALRDDIALDGVVVFGDGGITLLFIAPEEYPDLIIYCLLDEDLEIDDLMVE
ncbi:MULTISPECIES: hypothetical protein [unclassified Microbacterium]|uniref:hypothetical protein n=1 Tax=unclassified Microbacterium TaxID=2609290 RepID=UPI00230599E8|nr:hypothetical protein [Microbacterium sp. nov. GSS16]MEE2814047.1 hypothetical protein [Actinomycetota bacterium]WCD92352.1 hypothetical protein PGB26_11925 [Microbacterium sp. nov. GSS16]